MNEQERVLKRCLDAAEDWHEARGRVVRYTKLRQDAIDGEQRAAAELVMADQDFRSFLVADRT